MKILSKCFRKILQFFGLEKQVRELYKHSIYIEPIWKLKKPFIGKKVGLKEINGFKMCLNLFESGIQKDLWIHGERESESLEILFSELEEGMSCLDIGSNIGYYALNESSIVGEEGRVTAIEPLSPCLQILKKNIEINNIENIEIQNYAITKDTKDVEMLIEREVNRSRVINNKNNLNENTVDVEGKKLTEVVENSPDFIRMDLEGYESIIIDQIFELNLDGLLLLIELHPKKMKRNYGVEPIEFWNKLVGSNLHLKYIIQHGDRIQPSYFLRKSHPPRKIEKIDLTIEECMEKDIIPHQSERAYRAFLEIK